MTEDEIVIKNRSIEFAKINKKIIAKELTDSTLFIPDDFPVSVFMAGSPGAGKTESSKNLIKSLTKDECNVLRIDSDDLRARFQEYTGENSHLFMAATSIVADKVQDLALDNRQNFVFDGTLSNIDRARENIQRSLKKNRFVQILYVYQEPIQAWKFVQARALKDGRYVPREAFIEQYFLARKNTNQLKLEFGDMLKVDLVIKNIDGSDFNYWENIDVIDNYMPEKYTKNDLDQIIN